MPRKVSQQEKLDRADQFFSDLLHSAAGVLVTLPDRSSRLALAQMIKERCNSDIWTALGGLEDCLPGLRDLLDVFTQVSRGLEEEAVRVDLPRTSVPAALEFIASQEIPPPLPVSAPVRAKRVRREKNGAAPEDPLKVKPPIREVLSPKPLPPLAPAIVSPVRPEEKRDKVPGVSPRVAIKILNGLLFYRGCPTVNLSRERFRDSAPAGADLDLLVRRVVQTIRTFWLKVVENTNDEDEQKLIVMIREARVRFGETKGVDDLLEKIREADISEDPVLW